MGGYCCKKRKIRKFNINYDKMVFGGTILLLGMELYISYNAHFKTGWDASVIWDNARRIAFSSSEGLQNIYYSQNPNNILITSIGALILMINSKIGIFRGVDEYLALVFVNCICISLACFFTYKIMKHFVSSSLAFTGFIFSVLLFGISPWMMIYYSDTLGILFPVLIVYIFICPISGKWKNIIKYIVIFVLSSLGYYIKPQIMIVPIAIFIVEMGYGIEKANGKKLLCSLIAVLGMAICFVAVGSCLDKVYEQEGFKLNTEAKFGITHYFMMGLNEERNGVWAGDDVNLSNSCQTAAERKDVNIKVSIQRLKDFGIIGYARHLSKKILCTFNDGTFAWMHEGGFFQTVHEEPNTQSSSFIRSFYYQDGENLDRFMTFEQGIWIFILLMVFLATLWYRDGRNAGQVAIIMLCIIGIIIFELLFEVRARYLFIFAPFFCIIATIGVGKTWEKLTIIVDKILLKNKDANL